MFNDNIVEIGERINKARRVLVVSHIRPDGDAVGSLLGLGLALQKSDKIVQMVLSDGVPSSYQHLLGSEHVQKRPEGSFDLVFVLDCSDLNRAGHALDGYNKPDINIDHHITNLDFAKINLVEPSAVATAEIITEYMTNWGLGIDKVVADALLTGLITDTLGFRTGNMTPKALRTAARLIEAGSDLPTLYEKVLIDRTFEAARFWGAGLLALEREGPVVWTTLTMDDREACNYPGRDDADLINVLSSIVDANVSIIFVEQPNGNVKVSWRARPGHDVSKIALHFGGGGHPAAAGAEIQGSMKTAQSRVLEKTINELAKSLQTI
jgi:phosphoesterase RecJ-like protein